MSSLVRLVFVQYILNTIRQLLSDTVSTKVNIISFTKVIFIAGYIGFYYIVKFLFDNTMIHSFTAVAIGRKVTVSISSFNTTKKV